MLRIGIAIVACGFISAIAHRLAAMPQVSIRVDQAQTQMRAYVDERERITRQQPDMACFVVVGSASVMRWDIERLVEPSTAKWGFDQLFLRAFDSRAIANIFARDTPKLVLVYAGENDIVNGGLSADDVVHDFTAVSAQMMSHVPSAAIVFLSMKLMPSRLAFRDAISGANERIQRAIQSSESQQFYFDSTAGLTGHDGVVSPEFVLNQYYFNEAAYVRISARLKSFVATLPSQYQCRR